MNFRRRRTKNVPNNRICIRLWVRDAMYWRKVPRSGTWARKSETLNKQDFLRAGQSSIVGKHQVFGEVMRALHIAHINPSSVFGETLHIADGDAHSGVPNYAPHHYIEKKMQWCSARWTFMGEIWCVEWYGDKEKPLWRIVRAIFARGPIIGKFAIYLNRSHAEKR